MKCAVDGFKETGTMFRLLFFAFLMTLLSGCFVVTVNGEKPNDPDVETGGHYHLHSLNAGGLPVGKEDFQRDRGTREFLGGDDSIEISVNVTHEKIGKELHWLQGVNLVPACCTWFFWPFSVPEETDRFSVEVTSDLGRDIVDIDVKKNRWISLFSPLALIPAMFSDANVYGETPSEEEKLAASRKVAGKMVVRAVRSTLHKTRYDAYCMRRRKAAEKANAQMELRELAQSRVRREKLVRSFAMKEAPMMWQAVQNLRGEIELLDQNIQSLRKDLLDFGRDPGEDADFMRIKKMQADMQSSLDSIYRKLQDAYIAARKYDALPRRKDYEAIRRKVLEDGIREAEIITRRFKEMGRNK